MSALGIIALRGTDAPCPCSARGIGADSVSVNSAPAPMSMQTKLIWAGAIGVTALIFWGTLQPKGRRLFT